MNSLFLLGALLAGVEASCFPFVQGCFPPLAADECNALPFCRYDTSKAACVPALDCSSSGQLACAVWDGCLWNDPNSCDYADYAQCSTVDSDMMQCLLYDYRTDLENLFNSNSFDWDGTAIDEAVLEYSKKRACSCPAKYFSCLAAEDYCKSDQTAAQICQATYTSIEKLWGECTYNCSDDLEAEAVTYIIDVVVDDDSIWSDIETLDDFCFAISAWTGLDEDWIAFDASTHTITITIPAFSIFIPQEAELDESLEKMDESPLLSPFGISSSSVSAKTSKSGNGSGNGETDSANSLRATLAASLIPVLTMFN